MIIGLNVSLQKKWPTSFSNEPTTGGSMTPELLATQYKLHNLVLGLKSRSVRPSKRLPYVSLPDRIIWCRSFSNLAVSAFIAEISASPLPADRA